MLISLQKTTPTLNSKKKASAGQLLTWRVLLYGVSVALTSTQLSEG